MNENAKPVGESSAQSRSQAGASGQRFPRGNTINQSQANYYSYWPVDVPYYPNDVNATSGYHLAYYDNVYPTPVRRVRLRQTVMAFMTWPGMFGSGVGIGGTTIIVRRRGLTRVALPQARAA